MRARAHHRGFQGEELLEKNEEVRLQVLFDHGPDLLQRLRVHVCCTQGSARAAVPASSGSAPAPAPRAAGIGRMGGTRPASAA